MNFNMYFPLKELVLLAVLVAVTHSAVNVVIVLDEGNRVAQNGIEGALNYVERNNLATIGSKTFLTLAEEEPFQTVERVCSKLDNLIDDGTPPDLILDLSYGDITSEVVKSLSLTLGLPTVTSTMGEKEDINEWMELTPEQEKYLIQVRGPHDLFQFIIRDLAFATNITNAAVLFDDDFVMNHHYSNLFINMPVRHLINKLETSDKGSLTAQIKRMGDLEISNFFILGSNNNIKMVLEVANELKMYGEQYAWFAGTKEDDVEFDASCCTDMKVIYFKPEMESGGLTNDLKSLYGVVVSPIMEAAFYVDLGARAISAVESMKNAGTWPAMEYTKCSEYNSASPVARSLDLVSAIQSSSIPTMWGKMMLSSNGNSYMEFKLHVELNTAMDNTLMESEAVGMWHAGIPAEFSFEPMMEEKIALYKAKKVYRVVSVIQPPFMQWNETLKKYEGYCYDLAMEIKEILGVEVEVYMADSYGQPDEDGNWNGLVGELVNRRADMGIGAISVMAERENVIDFTVPYYDLVGMTILMKKVKVPTSLFKFLSVLEDSVWGCILGAYFVTSVLLWIFDRWSPYSYQNNIEKYEDDDEKRYFNLKEALWFCMTSLTPQGGGEAPKNLSGRLVAATWWLFGFIIIASYTANLAAFLTVSRLEVPVGSLDDLNKQFRIQFAPINGSQSANYFERMSYIEERFYEVWKEMSLDNTITEYERSKLAVWDYPVSDKYTKMWANMKDTGLPKDMTEALELVRASETQSSGFALIADATDVRYLSMTNCDLQMVGDEFSRKPYALAVQQGSPLKDQLNDAILRLLNQRKLEAMKERWWNQNQNRVTCEEDEEDTGGISIHNIGGVFIVIFAGIFLALITLAVEYWYYKHKAPVSSRVGSSTPITVKDKNGDFKGQNKW